MHKIKRLLYIHICLIYFTFIYSHSLMTSQGQVWGAAQEDAAAAASDSASSPLDEMTEDKIKAVKKQYMEFAKERLFDIRGKPNSKENESPITKLSVPSAILKEYISFRDEVREVVPDDRDFYGKINIEDLDKPRDENIWSGNYDIEIDMAPPPSDESQVDSESFDYKGGASHIALITLAREPQDVPPNIEAVLPPHVQNSRNQPKFISVHLHYNLSQEVYDSPTAADDLKKAELRLTREQVSHCDLYDCPKKPLPFFNREQPPVSNKSDHTHKVNNLPRYQRIFLLQVTGYDQFGDPKATVFATRRIDTRQTTTITFNISPIVKAWLMDAASNYGIIVRVRNDDDHQPNRTNKSSKAPSQTVKREINANHTIASDELEPQIKQDVLEHVRLKRAFKFSSDSAEIWRDKQPSILIWSKLTPSEPGRKHVKRHHGQDEMQADEPDTTTHDYHHQTSTSTHGSVLIGDLSTFSTTTTDKSTPSTTTSGSVARRDQLHTGANARRPNQAGRASSSGRPTSQQAARPKGKHRQSQRQTDKCSKRSLNINFDEVGWSSWIIAPHSYYANFCSGDCNWPLSDTQNSTNHAIIQAIYRSVGRLVPKSCCAPVKLGRMAILYQLDGIVQMRQYDDMIVEACGCL